MKWLTVFLAAMTFLASGAAFLTMAASAFAAAQERTVLYTHLDDALDADHPLVSRVSWRPAAHALVRDFTAADETLVGSALTSAWRAHAAAMETGVTDILTDHFSGVALARAAQAASEGQSNGTRLIMLSHSARPAFFHLDGSVLQVETDAIAVRFAVEDEMLTHFELTRDGCITTLMNETTGWRIFAHERRQLQPISPSTQVAFLPRGLAGINYYPAATPWRRFWPEFDARIIATDFKTISDLGANAVRVFLPVADFTDAETKSKTLENLEMLLHIAERHRLKVVPTLFDMKPSYSPTAWAEDMAYLETVLPMLAASGVVAMVDLKNEPDLDFDAQGRAMVEAWLRTMAALTREIAPGLPVTVGWSRAQVAEILAESVDVVSYHDYEPVDSARDRLNALRQRVAGKPVWVTEIGASSFSALGGFPGSEAAQASKLEARLRALNGADSLFVWTLHDFPAPDKRAVGASPWTLRLQAHFGLIDTDGVEKAAHRVIADAFAAWREQGSNAAATNP